jgi:chromosome segregation ATPase
MDYKAALAKIAEQADVVEAIVSHVGNLTTQISSLNSESASRRHELTEALKIIQEFKKIAGEEADLVKFASEIKNKLENKDATVSDLQSKLDTALALAATEQRLRIISKAAILANANEIALTKLLEKIPTEQIILEEKKVKVAGKELKSYAEETEAWMLPSLFPTTSSEAVPTGGASPETPANPTSVYLSNQAASLAKSLGIK